MLPSGPQLRQDPCGSTASAPHHWPGLHTKFVSNADIYTGDSQAIVKKLCEKQIKFDIVFLDPPYGKNLVNDSIDIIEEYQLLSQNGIIVAEHGKEDSVYEETKTLKRVRDQKYGDTVLSFYKVIDI